MGEDGRTATVFVLVPGFWLGGWAWDRVAGSLRNAGHRVETPTLPGLESRDAPRRDITLAGHIGAVAAVVGGLDPGVILVGHSGAGAVVYGVTDLMPERLRRVVYVDSGPPPDGAALSPDLGQAVEEIPLPSWSDLEAGASSLLDLDEAMLAEFRGHAVPHPARAGPGPDPAPEPGTPAGAGDHGHHELPYRGRPAPRRSGPPVLL